VIGCMNVGKIDGDIINFDLRCGAALLGMSKEALISYTQILTTRHIKLQEQYNQLKIRPILGESKGSSSLLTPKSHGEDLIKQNQALQTELTIVKSELTIVKSELTTTINQNKALKLEINRRLPSCYDPLSQEFKLIEKDILSQVDKWKTKPETQISNITKRLLKLKISKYRIIEEYKKLPKINAEISMYNYVLTIAREHAIIEKKVEVAVIDQRAEEVEQDAQRKKKRNELASMKDYRSKVRKPITEMTGDDIFKTGD